MDTLGPAIDRREPLAADSVCEEALTRFIRDSACMALAVLEDGRPVGIVQREAFLARMEAPGASRRPIVEAMEPDPLIAGAEESLAGFVARAMADRPAALLGGFIVTEAGHYVGVGDGLCLIRALGSASGPGPLIERFCVEVREPLAMALAAAEGLRRLRLPEHAAAHLDTITDASNSTLALLDVAAELQKAETGRLELRLEARRLQDLMDTVEARWRIRAEDAGVTLLVSYDGEPECAALVDEQRLLQAFDALIGHALAHVRHGVVEASLKARQCDSGVALTGRVRDNGADYAPGDLDRALGGVGAEAAPGGMGVLLGLALAERSIAAMSGRLSAEANVGAGATLTFEFIAPTADEVAAADHSRDAAEPGRSAHVLVVDDNATNRMVVEALCEMFDCSTESVTDGLEAVEAATHGRFDVILMDIRMPRMDGVAATREIRKLPGASGCVPIIALTANADPDEVAQYLAAGMQCVVEKPIKPERLMEALDSVLSPVVAAASDTAAAA